MTGRQFWRITEASFDNTFKVAQTHLLGEASARDTGHCPETSRDAKGQTRQGQSKALLKVAGIKSPLRCAVPKLNQ